jgi:hypothetical protein
MPAVHPTRLNVNSVCGRFSRFGDWRRLKLLNNDDWLLVDDSTHTKPSKAIERARKGMLPVHRRTPESPRAAEVSRTKTKVGQGQGNADPEYKTEDYGSSTT